MPFARHIGRVHGVSPLADDPELVNYALADDEPSDSQFVARLRRAQVADPDRGRDIFLQLLHNPLRRVREYAVIAGPRYGGSAVAGALPEMLDDRAWSVQELAMQSLSETAPDLLRQQVPTLRRKFREWRGHDDNNPVIHLPWTAVNLRIARPLCDGHWTRDGSTCASASAWSACSRSSYAENGSDQVRRAAADGQRAR